MCGRFYIDPDDMSDAELIALLDRERAKAESTGNAFGLALGEVRPGSQAAAIALNRRLQRSAFMMRWGFRVKNKFVINARSESASEKSTFRQSMQVRRCLIPASAYFEWDHRENPLQKYQFNVAENKLIYLAGLYRFEDSSTLPTFTILTREAAPAIACFHDRMPVIIPSHLTDAWLDHHTSPESVMKDAILDVSWKRAI